MSLKLKIIVTIICAGLGAGIISAAGFFPNLSGILMAVNGVVVAVVAFTNNSQEKV